MDINTQSSGASVSTSETDAASVDVPSPEPALATQSPVPSATDGTLATDEVDLLEVGSLPPEAPNWLSLLEDGQEFLQLGGPVVWILLGFSVIALTLVLLKLWQLALLRPESCTQLEQSLTLWREGRKDDAQAMLDRRRPVAEVVALAMAGLSAQNSDRRLLADELERLATLRLNQLRSYLRPLDVIATLSPLLGLFGTVLGMIVAFQQMEAAGNRVDPSILSGGIWQALLTTAVGLAVAIPVVMAHNWLERKTERVAALMNDAVTRVFTTQPGKLAPAATLDVKAQGIGE
jgi:biopolymer transport protein ExbB